MTPWRLKKQRVAEGVKASTINYSLEVVRTVLNRAARVWRTASLGFQRHR